MLNTHPMVLSFHPSCFDSGRLKTLNAYAWPKRDQCAFPVDE